MASRPSSFFESFQDFVHNPSAPVSAEFTRLAALRKWKVNSKTYRKMWKKCIYSEFEKNYGKEFSRLQCWQNLCSELQIGVFGSIRQCKMVMCASRFHESYGLTISRLFPKFTSTLSICWIAVLREQLWGRFGHWNNCGHTLERRGAISQGMRRRKRGLSRFFWSALYEAEVCRRGWRRLPWAAAVDPCIR